MNYLHTQAETPPNEQGFFTCKMYFGCSACQKISFLEVVMWRDPVDGEHEVHWKTGPDCTDHEWVSMHLFSNGSITSPCSTCCTDN